MRRRRRGCALGINDVATAFLQSDSYPDGTIKINTSAFVILQLTFGTTIVRVVLSTVRSAPQRDEKTPSHPGSSPWVSCEEKMRGPASIIQQLILLYVNDCLDDGDAADVQWICTELEERFKCKSADMITDLITQDYLKMVIRVEGDRIYMSMAKYIETACRILKIEGESWVPINQPIDTDSPVLSPTGKTEFLTAVGMLGWLAQTARFDVSYTFSRIAQHSASPTDSAMKAVRTVFAYFKRSKYYCISAQIIIH